MKEIKQKNLLICAGILTILLIIAGICFGYDDIVKASFEDEDKDLWDVYEKEYLTYEDGTRHVVIKVVFTNAKLFDDFEGTPTECAQFDFQFMPSGGNLDVQSFTTIEDLTFGESFEMTYDSVMKPVTKIHGTSESIEVSVRAFDEDNYVVNTELRKTISLLPTKQLTEPTSTPEPTPGFTSMFAIAAILLIAYLIKKK